jgi:hypothetical protein
VQEWPRDVKEDHEKFGHVTEVRIHGNPGYPAVGPDLIYKVAPTAMSPQEPRIVAIARIAAGSRFLACPDAPQPNFSNTNTHLKLKRNRERV